MSREAPLEYEAACGDPEQRIASGLSEEDVREVVSALCAVAEPVWIAFLWRPLLRDPADEMVLEAAINGNADTLVTFNRRDFGDAPRGFGTSINQFVTTAVAEKVAAMKTAEFFAARAGEADIEAARRILRRAGGRPPEPEDRPE